MGDITTSDARPSRGPEPAPWLVPALMISRGRVMLPAEGGPEVARASDGGMLDLFDLTDRLMAEYHRVYVVDLDGVDQDRPQLDYLQEIARGGDVWVDAGVRTADQAIDVLVAGAQRAVLSTSFLRTDRELRRAWKLSSDLVFEIEVRDGSVSSAAPEWSQRPPSEVAEAARAVGPMEIVLSYRESTTDWSMARGIAASGPVWIDGSFEVREAPRLKESGAAGAIFHLHEFLQTYATTREPA